MYRTVYYGAMDNRENFLKCALDLFALHGYDAVGVQAISEAAGIGKPTMYHYFGSKSGLLEALLKENLDPFMADLEEASRYRGDIALPFTRLPVLFLISPEATRVSTASTFRCGSRRAKAKVLMPCRHSARAQQEMIENLFASAVEDHGNMLGRQRTYAASFLGMVNTYIMLSLNGYADLDEAFVNSLLHHFMHGIFS